MKTLNNLIYLTKGNLPSKMAHTIQIAKMAQAFSQKLKNFELVTSGDILSAIQGMSSDFQAWYGLHHKFKLIRLPIHLKIKYPFPHNYENQTFYKIAILYACLKSPSVVYTRTPAIADLLLKIGVPVLWEWHEPIPETSSSFYQAILNNKNLLGIVTTLPHLAENYIYNGLLRDRILVAPNAVDLKNFLPYQDKQLARRKLSICQEDKIVLYSGHLYEYKGIPTILETARLLPDYKFVLVGGWADDIQKVQEASRKIGLSNITLVGHVNQTELASYLYAADVLILPTSKYWDLAGATCPLKLFDYMVSRRPIVASALPTIMTVARDKQNALLAEPDDPDSFKKAILKLFENPVLANTIAECAFQEVQNFTWDNRAEQVLQFTTERLQEVDEDVVSYRTGLMKYVKQEVFSRLGNYLPSLQSSQVR
ncbi:glycosyltransferase family 4 protein [Gloeocapsopsis dulcis]|uniref:Group 1 glycosyl transferase n=2 Tax=Gloeocapsopsis TaxID=693222 RepID=A0A6N8FV26_9CHRO|nr:glycosyltransferase family 4 protein [Gloeocapsopsis dulcis]MUL35806.1 group 1 glycosyl transferase [Gloeocapsopsis dulcis AAB1 = 1H9]